MDWKLRRSAFDRRELIISLFTQRLRWAWTIIRRLCSKTRPRFDLENSSEDLIVDDDSSVVRSGTTRLRFEPRRHVNLTLDDSTKTSWFTTRCAAESTVRFMVKGVKGAMWYVSSRVTRKLLPDTWCPSARLMRTKSLDSGLAFCGGNGNKTR